MTSSTSSQRRVSFSFKELLKFNKIEHNFPENSFSKCSARVFNQFVQEKNLDCRHVVLLVAFLLLPFPVSSNSFLALSQLSFPCQRINQKFHRDAKHWQWVFSWKIGKICPLIEGPSSTSTTTTITTIKCSETGKLKQKIVLMGQNFLLSLHPLTVLLHLILFKWKIDAICTENFILKYFHWFSYRKPIISPLKKSKPKATMGEKLFNCLLKNGKTVIFITKWKQINVD